MRLHALNIQAGTLYDKERLERGKSTRNLSILGKIITAAEAMLGAPKAAPATTTGSAPVKSANAEEDRA